MILLNIKASDLPVTHSTETSMPAYEGAKSTLSVMPMDIIGGDNRSKIADTTQFPYRAIGYIESSWPNGETTIGTGWLFKKDAIVTAGHCVYDSKRGGAGRSKLGSIRVEMGIHLRMVMRIQFVLARQLLGQARVIKIWTMGW